MNYQILTSKPQNRDTGENRHELVDDSHGGRPE